MLYPSSGIKVIRHNKIMANRARTQAGVTSKASREQDINPFDKLTEFYEEKKNVINTSVSVVLVLVVGYFVYTKMIKAPNEEKAANALTYPQMYFQADSLNLALNGDGKHKGMEKVAKQFSGTNAGNLASYYEGVAYLKMGEFPKAIKALQDFDGHGTLLAYQAWGALGEAYLETGNKGKAIENFKKATSDKDDVLLTPMYLYQLGLAYIANNQTKEAKDAFKRIRDEYPKSMQARDVEKELARLGDID